MAPAASLWLETVSARKRAGCWPRHCNTDTLSLILTSLTASLEMKVRFIRLRPVAVLHSNSQLTMNNYHYYRSVQIGGIPKG